MDIDPATLISTRTALQTVAEHLLAGELHRWNGRIGLRATPGGFGTPLVEVDGVARQLRVEGTELVSLTGELEERLALTTIGQVAALLGIEPGGPSDVYTLQTRLDPAAHLHLDRDAAMLVADWFAITAAALDGLGAAEDEPPVAQLWPEHFDLAVSIGECNFGGSPGDADHDLPYLYVGPWQPAPVDGFWNEAFGASLPWRADLTVDEAIAFLAEGRRRADRLPAG